MLLLSCPVRWCGSCPAHPTAVIASTAARVVHCSSPGAAVWCGCVCLCSSCGGVSSVHSPPRRGGGWGRRGWWGGIADGGWHGEGRAVVLLAPVECRCPRLCVGVPVCRSLCGPIEWRWGMCCDARLRIGAGTLHCPLPFSLSVLLVSFPFPFLFCAAVFVVGEEVRWGNCVSLSPSVLCLLSQH